MSTEIQQLLPSKLTEVQTLVSQITTPRQEAENAATEARRQAGIASGTTGMQAASTAATTARQAADRAATTDAQATQKKTDAEAARRQAQAAQVIAKDAADAASGQVSIAEARLKTIKDIVSKIRNIHPKSDQVAQQVIEQEADEKLKEREKKVMEEIQKKQNEANMVGQAGIEQYQTHQEHIVDQETVEQSQNQVGNDLVGDTGGYNIAHFHDDTYAQPAPGDSDANCLNMIDRCSDPDVSGRCAGTCGREVNGHDHGENCADLQDLCNHEAYNDLMSTYCKNSCGK
ncbi:hypothetical protein Ddc_18767 [Ditylenchus destructor]|nr:hypothetical protein Ddc_18767 [Ditylenchus destructor]